MRKLAIVGLGVAIAGILAVGATMRVLQNGTVHTGNSVGGSNTRGYTLPSACEVLTPAIAEQVVATKVKPSESNGAGNAENTDVKVTNCSYRSSDSVPGVGIVVGLLIRAAKSSEGAASNESQFGSGEPAGVAKVAGYGDAAFWDQGKGQLSILKHRNWHIVSKLHGAQPGKTTLGEVEQLTTLFIDKL